MKTLLRAVLVTLVISVAMWVVGRIASERFEDGTDPDDDEFRLAAFLNGKDVASHAGALRAASASVRVGGMNLDLSEATLDPDGAHLDLDVLAGGLKVTVHPGWRVYVVEEVSGGGIDIDLPDPDSLPADAPMLTIQATIRAGGVLIEAA